MVRTGEGWENVKGCVVLWEWNVMTCEKKVKLKSRSVRSRNQGVNVCSFSNFLILLISECLLRSNLSKRSKKH